MQADGGNKGISLIAGFCELQLGSVMKTKWTYRERLRLIVILLIKILKMGTEI